MITQLDSSTFWYEPANILINWDQMRYTPSRYHWNHSQLMLMRRRQDGSTLTQHMDANLLYVHKMRYVCLTEYKSDLDLILEEYELIDNGWRGQVRVSDAELTRWLLMCGL
jgi:hypothetical protein